MAEISVEGINLGYTEKGYDFVDEKGERRVGVSHLLHVLVDMEVLVVKVPEERINEAKALGLKEACTLRVDVPKSVRPTLVETAA